MTIFVVKSDTVGTVAFRRKMKIKCLLLILAALLACQDKVKGQEIQKRSDGGVDFLGMRVSYPQYLRLVAIQREVIRMDQTIRHMLNKHNEMELAQNPHWMELLELYDSLKKMLPEDYLEQQLDVS